MNSQRFSDADLLAFSEHVYYEICMLLWTASVLSDPDRLATKYSDDAVWLNNALVESFAIHVRTLIGFFYDAQPQPDDLTAGDFMKPGEWATLRPEISKRCEPQKSALTSKSRT